MSFRDFLAENQVFTTHEMLNATDNSPSARVALSHAVRSGEVQKVRVGLYVSQSGRFQGSQANPYLIADTFRKDAVFVYHSALELHGLAHSSSNRIQLMTRSSFKPFSHEGITFDGLTFRSCALTEQLYARTYGTVVATTREQTLVDCFAKVVAGGGAEEIIRSFAGLPYLDIELVLSCLRQYPSSVASRVGWYLEANLNRWSVSNDVLTAIESTISPQASYKLDPASTRFEGYNSRWRLNLPASKDTIDDWMEI
jgi:predicted transcriptional regulator of viral defense system